MELVNLAAESCILQLQNHNNIHREQRYAINEITTDRQASFNIFEGNFPGISVKKGEAGCHVPRADERCKMIKNMHNSLQSNLKFHLY